MNFRRISLVLLLGIIQSCASHTFMRGSVALKINNSSGIACLESNKVKEGDKLYLYINQCTNNDGDRRGQYCKLAEGGEIEITKMVSDHYYEFKTLSNLDFTEGSILGTKR